MMHQSAEAVLRELAQIGAISTSSPVAVTLDDAEDEVCIEEFTPVTATPETPVPLEEAAHARAANYNEHLSTLGPLLDAFQSNLRALNEWAESARAFAKPVETPADE